jgi:ABC-type nickel/cobalt efflux system permease component RcnA
MTNLAIVLGLLVGARHAFEPDHLAAISTLVTGTRSPRNATLLGLIWGLGHTLALLGVGLALVLAGGLLPGRLANAFELAVAAMLVVLGMRAIVRGLRNTDGHTHLHRHGGLAHTHGGAHDHVHVGDRAFAWRPLTIGIVHGLAGSGALTALAFAELPTTSARVVYMLLFGIGSIAGMTLATGIAGNVLARISRGERAQRVLAVTTGGVSCICGVLWALPLVG